MRTPQLLLVSSLKSSEEYLNIYSLSSPISEAPMSKRSDMSNLHRVTSHQATTESEPIPSLESDDDLPSTSEDEQQEVREEDNERNRILLGLRQPEQR